MFVSKQNAKRFNKFVGCKLKKCEFPFMNLFFNVKFSYFNHFNTTINFNVSCLWGVLQQTLHSNNEVAYDLHNEAQTVLTST